MGDSRLDRLLSLLESGSSMATRRAAAVQIGEIQKYHPHDLQTLLRRVCRYLRHPEWDTRVAAGYAIDAIAKNVPNWEPETLTVEFNPAELEEPIAPALTFELFNIERVLNNGQPLVASGGSEFDIDLSGTDRAARLSAQRKHLINKLGLNEFGTNDTDLVEDIDFDVGPVVKMEYDSSLMNATEVIAEQEGLSAREKNRLKREQRKSKKRGRDDAAFADDGPVKKKARTKTVVTDQPQTSDKIVLEKVTDNDAVDEILTEWPFEMVCDELLHQLFDPKWELRHGAAVGLREILKNHALGAGKTVMKSVDETSSQNAAWMADCALRLLAVLALDRFGDYGSDQVVAPVRETAGQALGGLLKHMSTGAVQQVLEALLTLQERQQWDVRHGGLLGIKYVAAVRKDIVEHWLPKVLPALIRGLRDADDEVRGVAADATLPLVELIARHAYPEVSKIVSILWNALLDLDDLTVSTSAILTLMAEFYNLETSHTFVLNLFIDDNDDDMIDDDEVNSASSSPLSELVPRLFPFMKHNNAHVRKATMHTLSRVLRAELPQAGFWQPVLQPLLRHVYQNVIVEDQTAILNATHDVWQTILRCAPNAVLVNAARPCLMPWFTLLVTPTGTPLDQSQMLSAKHVARPKAEAGAPKKRGKKKGEESAGAAATPTAAAAEEDPLSEWQDFFSLRATETSARMRVAGARALGSLAASWGADPAEINNILVSLLGSHWAVQRLTSGLVIEEWLSAAGPGNARIKPEVSAALTEVLKDENGAIPSGYLELNRIMKKLRSEAQALTTSFLEAGLPTHLAAPGTLTPPEQMSADEVGKLATELFDSWTQALPHVRVTQPAATRESIRNRLFASYGYLQSVQDGTHTTVLSCAAAALVATGVLPDKLNSVIQPLVHAIKKEENHIFQRRASVALAALVKLQVPRQPGGPNAKIIKNICTALVGDRAVTPSAAECATGEVRFLPMPQLAENADPVAAKADALARRGGEYSVVALCEVMQDAVLNGLPKLMEAVVQPLEVAHAGGEVDLAAAQARIDALALLIALTPAATPAVHNQLLGLLPRLFAAVNHPNAAVRYETAKALGVLANAATLPVMQALIEHVLPFLNDAKNSVSRMGAAQSIQAVVNTLDLKVLPYLVFLVVPILGRMSDQDLAVRETVTRCFSTLIKLMPLEIGAADPEGMDPALIEQKKTERRFLEQLLDNSKLDKYELAVKVNGDLRSYQQDGINWMAFLNKYQLHGILCDDMGLGKTLQTLCMVGSDTMVRRRAHAVKPSPDNAHMPSLVVCPTTVVAHWYYETLKFLGEEQLRPVMYIGAPAVRRTLLSQLKNYDLVVMSYDVVRNDVDLLSKIPFNYCVLDEGHIIKNGRTKITQAVKAIQAHHRLILSGTPIQNKVLELWSLFDFLMPGFLWTEKEFEATYGKPIQASRDPKCTEKEQEAGVLAMEALHRQVLPFLLRRLKEDVLDDLPPKIIQDYYCNLSPLQIAMYEAFAKSRINKEVNALSEEVVEPMEVDQGAEHEEGEKSTHVFQALQYLRKLCSHPSLVLNDKHPKYEHFVQQAKEAEGGLMDLVHAPKMAALKDLLNDCGIGLDTASTKKGKAKASAEEAELDAAPINQHRVLIFAQMKQFLDIIENDLFAKHMPSVSYMRLDGSVEPVKRQEVVNRFNADPTIDVLLLTTRVGGLGLTLTGADTVIFVEHDWNPMKDLQAMDRAHRLGQKKVVNVYRLITRGTLEEKIMGLQKFKLNLANTVINAENSSLRTMDTGQLLDLFQLSDTTAAAPGKGDADETMLDAVPEKGKKKSGLKAALENLQEMWDEDQYKEEFDLDNFVKSM